MRITEQRGTVDALPTSPRRVHLGRSPSITLSTAARRRATRSARTAAMADPPQLAGPGAALRARHGRFRRRLPSRNPVSAPWGAIPRVPVPLCAVAISRKRRHALHQLQSASADHDGLAAKVELAAFRSEVRWMFGFLAALVLAIAARNAGSGRRRQPSPRPRARSTNCVGPVGATSSTLNSGSRLSNSTSSRGSAIAEWPRSRPRT